MKKLLEKTKNLNQKMPKMKSNQSKKISPKFTFIKEKNSHIMKIKKLH